jgi:hypothetical protein
MASPTTTLPLIGPFTATPNNPQPLAAFTGEAEDTGYVRVSLLNQQHPEYVVRQDAWTDLALLYEGGAELKAHAERLLKKRPREDEEVYAARLDQLTYQNILGTGLGWYSAAMFEVPPEILFDGKHDDDFYDRFLENCDGAGTSYVDFWKKAFQHMLTFSCVWVLTDLKALEHGDPVPVTLEDERRLGLLDPHLAAYTPLNVINWRTDERGELRWVVVRTEVEDQEFLEERQLVTRWFYYDREEYRVYEDRRSPEEDVRIATNDTNRRAKLIRGPAPHALSHVKRVPVRRATLTGGLWVANRAYLQLLDHLNQDNTLKWALFMSNLAMPVIIGDTDASSLTYSETGYLQFPTGTEYKWSEPEGKSFSHSARRVESLREECFRSMHLQAQGRSMRATPAMQSGRSKILEMAPAKQILAGMGDDIVRHMQDVLEDVRDARKTPDVHPDVRGLNFQEDMTTEEVFAVTSLLSLRIPSKTFEKYIHKRVAKAWMADANREELTIVYDEIDAGPTIDEREHEDFAKRVKDAQDQIREAGGKRHGIGAKVAPGDLTDGLPPGRGGSGPKPKKMLKRK